MHIQLPESHLLCLSVIYHFTSFMHFRKTFVVRLSHSRDRAFEGFFFVKITPILLVGFFFSPSLDYIQRATALFSLCFLLRFRRISQCDIHMYPQLTRLIVHTHKMVQDYNFVYLRPEKSMSPQNSKNKRTKSTSQVCTKTFLLLTLWNGI